MKITLATKITISRILLMIPTVVLYVSAFFYQNVMIPLLATCLALYALLCISDVIDGIVARKTKTVSDLGKFLDPLADKITCTIMLFLFIWSAPLHPRGFILFPNDGLILAVLSAVILIRELIISIFRAVAVQKGVVLAADIFGKIKTNFLNIGTIILVIAPINIANVYLAAWLGTIAIYIGGFFAIFSGINYIVKNKAVFAPPKEEKQEE